ncbi:multicopper oxidase domain-containing protein, partial [bacterium]|nr:multicopper oxidase domain-containing protein [bacterium]
MNHSKKILFIITLSIPLCAKIVEYNFDINYKKVSFAGKPVTAMAIDNCIPGPTIEAHEGDTLRVTFHNKMNVETSIHWHGILLPNDQDGVPYITTPPIKKHKFFTYEFKVKQAGTYWYHSHTGLQEQLGIYGALVFHPRKGEKIKTDNDQVLLFSDWTNEKPSRVLAHLKMDGDYYALKKGTVLSWDKVIKNGLPAIKNKLSGAITRMGLMDISDIGYDAFLTNGKQTEYLKVQPDETVRLRLINAAASTYFNIEFAGGPMTIVAADGLDIIPQKVKRLRMAVAETYDVIIKISEKKSYELRATAEDGTDYSSTFIGIGKKVFAPNIPRPNLFLMRHDKHKNHTKKNHTQKHDTIKHMTDYAKLRSVTKTSLPENQTTKKIEIQLTGTMDGYRWSFDNKIFLEQSNIEINKEENVHFILNNKTMMHHPIHLHGHFFQVLNGQGDYAPLKHTVDIPAMDTVEIAFDANENHHWLFHCHNLYHMLAGMMRTISYKHSTPLTEKKIKLFSHDPWYYFSDMTTLSQMILGEIRLLNTRNSFELEYDYNYKHEYDIELRYFRNFTKFFDAYIGAEFERDACIKKCVCCSKTTK